MIDVRLHRTTPVPVGGLVIGGGAPVAVQSMTLTDTADAAATAAQCIELAEAGSELVRVTVNQDSAAHAVPEIKQRMLDVGCTAPLIGDFHYNGHLLLTRYPACAAALEEVVTLLAERGAALDARNGRGETPLDLALADSNGAADAAGGLAALLRALGATAQASPPVTAR